MSRRYNIFADICNIYHLCYDKKIKNSGDMQSNNRYMGICAKLMDTDLVQLHFFSKFGAAVHSLSDPIAERSTSC